LGKNMSISIVCPHLKTVEKGLKQKGLFSGGAVDRKEIKKS